MRVRDGMTFGRAFSCLGIAKSKLLLYSRLREAFGIVRDAYPSFCIAKIRQMLMSIIRCRTLRAIWCDYLLLFSLRLTQILYDEAHFAWREPFGGLAVTLGVEGCEQGTAAVNPRHEAVDCHMWVFHGWEVHDGEFLLGVRLYSKLIHGVLRFVVVGCCGGWNPPPRVRWTDNTRQSPCKRVEAGGAQGWAGLRGAA